MKNKELTEFKLNERKSQLLLNAVENYIENASPITSERVQTNIFSTLSSATLRNELNALEEMGYLRQLHTSGGRVPTTKAYRYYVDSILSHDALNIANIAKVEEKFRKRTSNLQDFLDSLAQKVSDIVEYPTFVQLSNYKSLTIEAINVIPIITGEALMLVKTNAGIINNTIPLKSDVSEENCKDASKFLTNHLANKKIKEIFDNYREYTELFKKELNYFQDLFFSLTQILKDFALNKSSSFKQGNTNKLLGSPEYNDINSAKKLLNVIENKDEIIKIMDNIESTDNSELVFSIGDENQSEELNEYSIIKANYSLSDGIVASIGVVGPERMDYARIASVLKFITDEINEDANKTDKGDNLK